MISIFKKGKKFLLVTVLFITGITLLIVQKSDSYSNDDSAGISCYSYYFGNWDMHIGGCWEAEPFNCTGCRIPSLN
jgi:hypothetical protein